jgi:hypothetical protein
MVAVAAFCPIRSLEPGRRSWWSTYWYNNFIYESDITAGLQIYGLSDKARAGAIRLSRLNPQTQEALPR